MGPLQGVKVVEIAGLGGSAHWVNSYACADGRYITVQAVEPNLYQELAKLTGFADDPDFTKQYDTCRWKAAKQKFTELFASKPQSHWCELLEGTDACFAAVLTFDEVAQYPHNQVRNNFVEVSGQLQPAPAPKFDLTPSEAGKVAKKGEYTEAIITELGLSVEQLKSDGVI